MDSENLKNLTVTELATHYMQSYYAELSVSGEDSPITQEYKACWELYRNAARRLRYVQNLETTQPQPQPSKKTAFHSRLIQMLLDKFRSK